jgi:hypothetical protein
MLPDGTYPHWLAGTALKEESKDDDLSLLKCDLSPLKHNITGNRLIDIQQLGSVLHC